jgi:acetylcholinesterase
MLDHYPSMSTLPNHRGWFAPASLAYGEATFVCPSNTILNAFSAAGLATRAWSWRFNVFDRDNDAAGLGVPHVFDAPAVFGPWSVPSAGSYFSYNWPVVPLTMGYVLSFVRTLDPNRLREAGAPTWESWGEGEQQRRMVIELNTSHVESVGPAQRKRCLFWKDVGKVLRQKG